MIDKNSLLIYNIIKEFLLLREGLNMNKRNTIQKTLVLEVAHRLRRHVTADEVYDEVVKTHPNISKATVYRNLKQLAKDGRIRRVDVANGADCFDYILEDHYHARCLKCGKIMDVKMNYMEHLETAIEDSEDFVFSGHDIMFKGICKECI